jgi:hypothetical protein
MKILRKYKGEINAKWEEITIEKTLELTEGSGYWKENTVEDMLKDGITVWTPWAFYKKEVV